MTHHKRSIWRVEKPKRWVRPDTKLIEEARPRLVTTEGQDLRCAMGDHKYSGMKNAFPYEREPGFWVERYIPTCSVCGAEKLDDEGRPLMFDGKRIRPNAGEI